MRNKKILVGLTLALLIARPVQASEILWEDDFAGAWRWTEVRNAALDDPHFTCLTPSGKPEWQIIDGGVEINIDGSIPCATEIIPQAEVLAAQRAQRVTFKMFISNRNMDRNLLIRWQDSANRLGIHFFGGGIFAEKVVKGQVYSWQNGERGFNFQENHWYDVRWEYDLSARRLQLWLDNQLALDALEPVDEPQLEQGRPGLAASVGAVSHSYVKFDDFRVESLEQIRNLEVPLVKQTADPWQKETYDHARNWAPHSPLIKYWGCALASGVMVLRYYGIDHLPDGTLLDPGSLNTWLLAQNDGYLPDGSVNWRALSRLSLIFAQIHAGAPVLEMTFVNPGDPLTWLREQITNNQPVILAEPGHFVTTYGFGPGSLDFNIHDPFYTRLRLSAYGNSFTSARLFTPSHTDLSAITVVVPLTTQVTFKDSEGRTLIPIKLLERSLITDELYQIYDLPKPSPDVQVTFTDSRSLSLVWLVAYNSVGTPIITSQIVSSTADPVIWEIDLTTEQPQVSYNHAPFETLTRASLIELYLADQLRHPALVDLIWDYQNRLGNAANPEDGNAIIRSFNLTLSEGARRNWLSNWLTAGLSGYLQQLLLQKFP